MRTRLITTDSLVTWSGDQHETVWRVFWTTADEAGIQAVSGTEARRVSFTELAIWEASCARG
jgi:hypothetical protein